MLLAILFGIFTFMLAVYFIEKGNQEAAMVVLFATIIIASLLFE